MVFLQALGVELRHIAFSSYTTPKKARRDGNGRETLDCCYPVKCMSGHFSELIHRGKTRIDLLLCPMIYSLPSVLNGKSVDTLACPQVTAAPENIRARYLEKNQLLEKHGIRYVAPLVSLGDPHLVPRQLFEGLMDVIPELTLDETRAAVSKGYGALRMFNERLRRCSRWILDGCARDDKPCLMILARPYHMDPGISHDIALKLQAHGLPVLWAQYFPMDLDLLYWMFESDLRAGTIASPFDISDLQSCSNSANSNEILWGAKLAARMPWVAGVLRLSSHACRLDQPTWAAVKGIVEDSGTLFFSLRELAALSPTGRLNVQVETIVDDLRKHGPVIVAKKKAASPPHCPLRTADETPSLEVAQAI
jgi:predicted nucleotide-binding protein (sugar kinase/HSP70/actin superfamily)